jgi:hypothetical protein
VSFSCTRVLSSVWKRLLRVKVNYPATATSEWVDEELVNYADPLNQLKDKKLIISAEDIPERDIEDFNPLLIGLQDERTASQD